MSKYFGLFTLDIDNHSYVPIAQADGIIDNTSYESAEPLIKDEKVRRAVRAWAEANHLSEAFCCIPNMIEGNYGEARMRFEKQVFSNLQMGTDYTIAQLCGEEK